MYQLSNLIDMTYYLALFDNEALKLNCERCLIETMVEDEDCALKVYNFYNNYYHGYGIDSCDLSVNFNTMKDYSLKTPNLYNDSYPKALDEILSICPQIEKVLEALSRDKKTKNATVYEISDIELIANYIYNSYECTRNNSNNLTFAQIEPRTKVSTHYDFFHTAGDYRTVHIWNFDTDFIEHLISEGLSISDGAIIMQIAIQSENLKMIDRLIAFGVDINFKIHAYCGGSYAELAAETSQEVLKHVLDHKCHHVIDALLICIRKSNREMMQIVFPYCEMEDLTMDDKRHLVLTLIESNSVDFFEDFRKAGFIVTNEIIGTMMYDCGNITTKIVEYLLSNGINIKYFRDAYFFACMRSNLQMLDLLEKSGIFGNYRPISFLTAANNNPEIIERLLGYGIDTELDRAEIDDAYVEMCSYNSDYAKFLEPYVDLSNNELLERCMLRITSPFITSEKFVKAFKYFVEKGATLSQNFILFLGINQPSSLECALKSELEFEVDIYFEKNMIEKEEMQIFFSSTQCTKIAEMFGNASLLEIVVSSSADYDFEYVFTELIKRGAKLDSQRLTKIMDHDSYIYFYHNDPHSDPRVKYLIQHHYLNAPDLITR